MQAAEQMGRRRHRVLVVVSSQASADAAQEQLQAAGLRSAVVLDALGSSALQVLPAAHRR